MIFAQAITPEHLSDAAGLSPTTALIIYLAGLAIVSFVSAYLNHRTNKRFEAFRADLETKNQRDLASHTAELSRKNEVELSLHKHRLELAAKEREIKLTRIAEIQMEAITTFHRMTIELHDAVSHYTQLMELEGDPNRDKAKQVAQSKLAEFYDYFRKKRIFIPKPTADKLLNAFTFLQAKKEQFGIFEALNKSNTSRLDPLIAEIAIQLPQISMRIPALLQDLEAEFQRVLGVTMEEAQLK